MDLGNKGLPARVCGQGGPASRAVGHVLVSPHVDYLVERSDVGGEVADQLAQDGLLDRVSLLLIQAQVFGYFARIQRVVALLYDRQDGTSLVA